MQKGWPTGSSETVLCLRAVSGRRLNPATQRSDLEVLAAKQAVLRGTIRGQVTQWRRPR